MKNYYRILDLPETATLSQLKWQYKQLVRVYHPDRFKDPADKTFAENKLKEIIEAYRALSVELERPRNTHTYTSDDILDEQSLHPPRPIVSHSFLDFGSLNQGQRETITIQVGNMGGVAQQISFILSEPSTWFTISEQKQLYQDKLLPVEVDVTVDTSMLKVGKVYDGWIDVNLDNATTRVNLAAQIVDKKRKFPVPVRFIVFLGLLLIISSVAGFMTTAFFSNANSSIEAATPVNSGTKALANRTEPYLTFAAQEGNEQAIFAAQINGSRQFKLNLDGSEPAWSAQQRQVAYIGYDIGNTTQLYVAEVHNFATPSEEENSISPIITAPEQLTQSDAFKSAPSWSPDGRRIAYVMHPSEDPINQTGSLALVELESGQEVQLTQATDGNVVQFTWSTDGDSVLVTLHQGREDELKIINVATGEIEPLAREDAFIGVEANGGAWLTDNSGVVLTSPQGLFLLNLQSESTTQLFDRAAMLAQSAPQSNKVAFLSSEGGSDDSIKNLWVIDADGENATQITESGCLSYAWSPDGTHIAFTTGNLASDSPTLYLWVMKLGDEPRVVAEVNTPSISWLH